MNGGNERDVSLRDGDGRFYGYRVNVEAIPRIPTFAGRWTVQDPRRIPYLLVWRGRSSWEPGIKFALRLEPSSRETEVIYRYPHGREGRLSLVWRERAAGRRALFWRCGGCLGDRLYLYLASVYRFPDGSGRAVLEEPRCSRCAGLRWHSQGDYRNAFVRDFLSAYPPGTRLTYPRSPWDPDVVSDPAVLADEFPEFLSDLSRAIAAARGVRAEAR